MAIDNTPPRLRLIVTIAVIVVITLFSLNFVFESYYAYMADDAARAKLAPTTDRDDHRKAEAAALGAANLDKAMSGLAQSRGEIISAKPSEDTGPLTGWTKLPKPLPANPGWGLPPAPPHDGPPGAPLAGDGGAPTATDGGAPTATDGGAPTGAKDGGALAPAPKPGGH